MKRYSSLSSEHQSHRSAEQALGDDNHYLLIRKNGDHHRLHMYQGNGQHNSQGTDSFLSCPKYTNMAQCCNTGCKLERLPSSTPQYSDFSSHHINLSHFTKDSHRKVQFLISTHFLCSLAQAALTTCHRHEFS